MANPYFMKALLGGLSDHLNDSYKEQAKRNADSEAQDREIFETLIKSGNRNARRIGLAGLMENRGKGWFGKLRDSKVMPQVDALLHRAEYASDVVPDAAETPTPAATATPDPAPAEISTPKPSAGAPPEKPSPVAQSSTAPSQGGEMTLTPGVSAPPAPSYSMADPTSTGGMEPMDLPTEPTPPPTRPTPQVVAPPPAPSYASQLEQRRSQFYDRDPLAPSGEFKLSPYEDRQMQARAAGLSDAQIQAGERAAIYPELTRQETARENWAQRSALAGLQHGYKLDETSAKNQLPVTPQDADRYGLPAGSMIDARLLTILHADTRSMDNVAARRYAADKAGSHAIQAVFTGNYDDTGTPIMTYMRKDDLPGQNVLQTPSATETRVTKQAGRIQTGAGALQQELQDPNIRAQLGPAMGRYNKLAQWYGAPDPALTEFKAHLMSWLALQPALHGFRGINAMEHFEELTGAPITTPEALEAAIRGINKTAKSFTQPSAAGGGPPAGPGAGKTKKTASGIEYTVEP